MSGQGRGRSWTGGAAGVDVEVSRAKDPQMLPPEKAKALSKPLRRLVKDNCFRSSFVLTRDGASGSASSMMGGVLAEQQSRGHLPHFLSGNRGVLG